MHGVNSVKKCKWNLNRASFVNVTARTPTEAVQEASTRKQYARKTHICHAVSPHKQHLLKELVDLHGRYCATPSGDFPSSSFHGATARTLPGPPNCRGITITLRHATVWRTPLDEWSDRRRDLYLITYNTHKRQSSMPPAGFEPAIPASERPHPLGTKTRK
jgi:hypothetical protein